VKKPRVKGAADDESNRTVRLIPTVHSKNIVFPPRLEKMKKKELR